MKKKRQMKTEKQKTDARTTKLGAECVCRAGALIGCRGSRGCQSFFLYLQEIGSFARCLLWVVQNKIFLRAQAGIHVFGIYVHLPGTITKRTRACPNIETDV